MITAVLLLSSWSSFAREALGAEPLTPCASEPTDMVIGFGDVVQCGISPAGDSDIFRFEGTTGTTIVLTLLDLSFGGTSGYCQDGCPTAALFEPGSVTPSHFLNPGTSELRLDLGLSGTYTLIVTEQGDNQRQNYRIALERLAPASPTATAICHGCVLTNQSLDPAPDRDFVLFNVTEGATFSLTLTDLTFGGTSGYCQDGCPKAEIFDPNNELVDTLGPGTESATLTALLSGTYMVHLLEDGLNNAQSYNLALQCLFPASGQRSCDASVPLPKCKGKKATILGSGEDDILYGTEGPDVIVGLGGNDILHGLAGNDRICGGSGDDILNGGEGDDILEGDGDADILAGEAGRDTLRGGPGNDNLLGGSEDDVLNGQGGADLCAGAAGVDRYERACELVVDDAP